MTRGHTVRAGAIQLLFMAVIIFLGVWHHFWVAEVYCLDAQAPLQYLQCCSPTAVEFVDQPNAVLRLSLIHI